MRFFDELPLADVEVDIRDALTTIRRCWPKPDAPRGTGGSGSHKGHKPGSAAPGGSPTVLRASLVHTLAHWVHVAVDDGKIDLRPDQRIDLADPMSTSALLLANVGALVGWSQARHVWRELRAEATALERLTREPAMGIHLGDCPRERVLASGERVVCGGALWATGRNASDVKCPLCGASDTVEQWRREIVGSLGEMTTEDLAAHLRRLGIRQVGPAGVRSMVHRGQLPKPRRDETTGRNMHDVHRVLEALTDADARALGA